MSGPFEIKFIHHRATLFLYEVQLSFVILGSHETVSLKWTCHSYDQCWQLALALLNLSVHSWASCSSKNVGWTIAGLQNGTPAYRTSPTGLNRTLLMWEVVWGIHCLIDTFRTADCSAGLHVNVSMLRREGSSQHGHRSDFCPFSDSYQSISSFQMWDFSILEEYVTDFFTPTLFQDETTHCSNTAVMYSVAMLGWETGLQWELKSPHSLLTGECCFASGLDPHDISEPRSEPELKFTHF